MDQQPNVGASLLLIHHIITRGLEVAIEQSGLLAKSGFTDSSLQEGFTNYARTLLAVLRAHHLTEDELVFPYLQEKLKLVEAPFDVLELEHHAIEFLLPQLDATIGKLQSDAPGPALQELSRLFRMLNDVWGPHIRKEEEHFTLELLGQLIGPEEHVRLIRDFAAHSQSIAKPDYLVVPFLLFNLDREERAHFSRALPPTVTEQLVPGAWKEKWASMRPFLLG